MTVKRFVYCEEENGEFPFPYIKYENKKVISLYECCQLLNELHEENQDFKSFNQDLCEELSVCGNARISKDIRIEKLTEEKEHFKQSFNEVLKDLEVTTFDKELLEKENEQLKKDIEYYKTERLALFEYLDKKDDLKLELKVEK